MGRYLVFGCLFAAIVQVYVPTRILTSHQRMSSPCDSLAHVLAFLLSFVARRTPLSVLLSSQASA